MSRFASVTIVALLSVVVCGSSAIGQSTNAQIRKSVPASRRVIRFVPKHRKMQKLQQLQTAKVLDELAVGQEMDDAELEAAVTQASYVEDMPFGAPACHGCNDSGCSGCGSANYGPQPRVSTKIEYLLFSTKGMNSPSLATTSPDGTARDDAGVLGQGATTLFGSDELNDDHRSGVRFSLGLYFEGLRNQGIEITYLILEEENESFFDSNINRSILARPFFSTTQNADDSRLIAFPALVAGTLSIESSTKFHTADFTKQIPIRMFGFQGGPSLGYRYANLEDDLAIRESTISLDAPTLDTLFELEDRFETENTFHGGQLGFRMNQYYNSCWSIELLAKVAFGNTNSRASVSGQTVTTPPNVDPITTPSGLLVLDSNSGTFEQDEFSTIFDVAISLERNFACGITASVGYSFLYWSDVLRAAEQIDTTLNQTQIPPSTLTGAARPEFNFNSTEFWAQGVRFGFEYRW